MSSSVSTNQGPRQGPADKDVSQLFDTASNSNTRLPLPAGSLNRTISVPQKKKLLRKLCYPKLVAKIERAGFAYELMMEDISLTNLETNAVPSSRTSTVINITRQLDSKGKEFLWFTTVERGYDANNQEVIGSGSVIEHNKDKDVVIKSIRNSDGEITKLQLGNVYTDILTEEYNKDKVTEILSGEKYEISPNLSLAINEAGGRSWSGMSQLEFEQLDAKELIWRCKYDRCNEDLTVRFTDLTSAQKLNLVKK